MNKSGPRLRGLYAVTPDTATDLEALRARAEAVLRGGARLLQYRDKSADTPRREREARILLDICERHGALLIINDDVRLAGRIGAHGVHLGQQDMPLPEARAMLGREAVIGITCHGRLDLALAAQSAGADYVAFGAVYPSPTKPDAVRAPLHLFTEARAQLSIPICAIGGIEADNAAAVIAAGADMVAVVSGVFAQPDPETEARRLSTLFARARDKRPETRDKLGPD